MAAFQSRCGATLSSATHPELRLIVFTKDEVENKLRKMGTVNSSALFMKQQFSMWECTKCKRLYVFRKNKPVKEFRVISDVIYYELPKQFIELYMYDNDEWEQHIDVGTIDSSKLPYAQKKAYYNVETEMIAVTTTLQQQKVFKIYELDEDKWNRKLFETE